ncbi:putative photosystem I [Helianthus debilis subsp. tardiflorus]
MWIGGFLIVGAAAHAAIFMVRDYDPTTLLPKGVAMPYAKGKRLIEWQRQIELLHIFVNP